MVFIPNRVGMNRVTSRCLGFIANCFGVYPPPCGQAGRAISSTAAVRVGSEGKSPSVSIQPSFLYQTASLRIRSMSVIAIFHQLHPCHAASHIAGSSRFEGELNRVGNCRGDTPIRNRRAPVRALPELNSWSLSHIRHRFSRLR
jgi:hypothetical protein